MLNRVKSFAPIFVVCVICVDVWLVHGMFVLALGLAHGSNAFSWLNKTVFSAKNKILSIEENYMWGHLFRYGNLSC